MSDEKHPMQPIVLEDGIARFKKNQIVRFLLDAGPYDLNKLASVPFSSDDWNQFYQLIGYSVSGFGDLELGDSDIVAKADAIVEEKLRS